MKNRIKISKIISLAVIACGVSVILGWYLDVDFLKSLSPVWTSMKFTAAVSFVFSGVILYFVAKNSDGEHDVSSIALSVSSFIVVLLIGVMFFSALLNVHTGLEELFVKEKSGAVDTVFPGRPSFFTMTGFLLVAAAGITTTFQNAAGKVLQKIAGYTIGITGIVAVIGYALSVPLMYYYISGVNSAMALNTALLFVLLGAGFICQSE